MNVVFDNSVTVTSESRSNLNGILPEGLSPLVLDSMDGLKGTIDEKEGIIFITDLPIDILAYHGTFFKKYCRIPQWNFILLGNNEHGISLLRDAATKYKLKRCWFYYAPNSDMLTNAVSDIKSRRPIANKVLITSKHKMPGYKLSEFLFGSDTEKYEFQIASEVTETCASTLIICGEEQSNFKNVNLSLNMDPYFVVVNPEKHIQQFLHPEKLISVISANFNITLEKAKSRLFFISTDIVTFEKNVNITTTSAETSNIIWDEFGLPISRHDYTSKLIEERIACNQAEKEKLINALGLEV